MKKFLKPFLGVVSGLLLVASVFAMQSWIGSTEELRSKRMLFTSDGTNMGPSVFDINTGGNVISYGPLLDGGMNPYITGYTETEFRTGDGTTLTTIQTGGVKFIVAKNSTASGDNATVFGENNHAPAINTFVVGLNNTGAGAYSFVGGFQNNITGQASFVFGTDLIVPSNYSAVFGQGNFVFGDASAVFGFNNTLRKAYSFVAGYGNEVNKVGSHAIGTSLINRTTDSVVVGKYNLGITGSVFEVGNGSSSITRTNALTIYADGSVLVETIKIGTGWQLTISGATLSIQAFTGGVWAEKWAFTP